jgi:predicted nuclease of predicted toxin-antitoxin system
MDVHVPAAISRGLRRRGVDVLRAQEDHAERLPDSELLRRATQAERLLFSQDKDLLAEGAVRRAKGEHFAGIVFARQTAVSIGACVRDLEIICKVLSPEEVANKVIYLPL